MNKFVLASSNTGKLAEFAELLAPFNYEVVPQSDFSITSPPETGQTFVENAIIKARHACLKSGLPSIADDSGLEVDFLDGAPGIYSARYAGECATDFDNLTTLLAALNDVPDNLRSAHYQCVLVMMRHALDPTPLICQASWHGRILPEPRGHGGFGYDPIFWVPETKCSAAELTSEQKHAFSHRGQALRQLADALNTHRHV